MKHNYAISNPRKKLKSFAKCTIWMQCFVVHTTIKIGKKEIDGGILFYGSERFSFLLD